MRLFVLIFVLTCLFIGLFGCTTPQNATLVDPTDRPIRGSAQQIVIVVDQSGHPIAGASVEAVSLSINSEPALTNAKGEATLPMNIQGTKWIRVEKEGYQSVHEDVPNNWPVKIVLQP